MGIRFQRRINLGKGLGINLSKRGASLSVRTKMGSINSEGFSIRTGIKGFTYQDQFKSLTKQRLMMLALVIIAMLGFYYVNGIHF